LISAQHVPILRRKVLIKDSQSTKVMAASKCGRNFPWQCDILVKVVTLRAGTSRDPAADTPQRRHDGTPHRAACRGHGGRVAGTPGVLSA